ncbi:MAG: hypothetical protein LBH53_01095 [Puniceicoccales bacterium]|jgi:hypothetical protein|nr:hypothetical protein [Puniceicoccales bacterium]
MDFQRGSGVGRYGAIFRPDDLCVAEDRQFGAMMGCPANSCDIQDEIFPPFGEVLFRYCPSTDENAKANGASPAMGDGVRCGTAIPHGNSLGS